MNSVARLAEPLLPTIPTRMHRCAQPPILPVLMALAALTALTVVAAESAQSQGAAALVSAPVLQPVSHHDGSCFDGGEDTTVTVRLPPGSAIDSFSWPPLPPSGASDYAPSFDQAVLALPRSCVEFLELAPNAGNGPGLEHSLWLGRLSELPRAMAAHTATCGCGLAIMACGSGGCTGDNVRQMRAMAHQGYSVLAVDSMASTSPTYPRSMPIVANLSQKLRTEGESYWCAKDLYDGTCDGADAGGNRPGCFSSRWDRIVYDPVGWCVSRSHPSTSWRRLLL